MTTSNKVCIAVSDEYDNSMGAYLINYFFDIDTKEITTTGGIYSDAPRAKIDASRDQIIEAGKHYMESLEESHNYNKYAGCYTYVGCVVTLKRARKAPNKTPLKVTAFHDGYYDSYYNNRVQPRVDVLLDDGTTATVSINCVNDVVKGIKETPFWYIEG